jgi:hypothetical protein
MLSQAEDVAVKQLLEQPDKARVLKSLHDHGVPQVRAGLPRYVRGAA